VLLSALLARALEFCMHDKGVYVAQCAANLASNSELVEMAKVGRCMLLGVYLAAVEMACAC
jgi:hypothetical protein